MAIYITLLLLVIAFNLGAEERKDQRSEGEIEHWIEYYERERAYLRGEDPDMHTKPEAGNENENR